MGLAQSEGHTPGGLVVVVDAKSGAVKWTFNTVPQGPKDDGWEIAKARGAAVVATSAVLTFGLP